MGESGEGGGHQTGVIYAQRMRATVCRTHFTIFADGAEASTVGMNINLTPDIGYQPASSGAIGF